MDGGDKLLGMLFGLIGLAALISAGIALAGMAILAILVAGGFVLVITHPRQAFWVVTTPLWLPISIIVYPILWLARSRPIRYWAITHNQEQAALRWWLRYLPLTLALIWSAVLGRIFMDTAFLVPHIAIGVWLAYTLMFILTYYQIYRLYPLQTNDAPFFLAALYQMRFDQKMDRIERRAMRRIWLAKLWR